MFNALWVEDGAFTEVPQYTGPVYADGNWNLDVATNATDALQKLLDNEYDAVVVDVRIPPGSDKRFKDYYNIKVSALTDARLGIELLKAIFKPENEDTRIKLEKEEIKKLQKKYKGKIGILSIEEKKQIMKDADMLKIKVWKNKALDAPESILLDMFNEILVDNQK